MSVNKKSQFQRYWSRIDNSPGKLDYATPEQLAEVKQMVKEAFHAGHGMYRKHITELQADKRNLLDTDLKARTMIQQEKEIIALQAQVADFESDAYVLSLLTKIDELEAKPREVMWESLNGMIIYTYEVGANSRNIEMYEGPWKRIGFTDE